ncbi:MAG: class I SAM-dependent methyltransferase [Endozoicomonas sp.]
MQLQKPSYSPLSHQGGVAYKVVNPLIHHWIECWNGSEPLLDIGCGNCLNASTAVDAGARVYATEMARNTVVELQQRYADRSPNLSFHFLQLPHSVSFPDNHFSGILCSEVFHFLDHDEVLESIRQFHRLLTPGGRVILTCASEELEQMKPLDMKAIREAQRQAAPDRMDALQNAITYFEQLARMHEPDPKAWEYIELYKAVFPVTYFNVFNPDQLARAFIDADFNIELISTGPAPYYALWEHGDQDQIRLVARKIQ